MAGDPVGLLHADAVDDGLRLGHGAHVGPDQRVAQRPGLAIHDDAPHHLAAEGDAGDLLGLHLGRGEQLPGGGAHGLPPVLRVLLDPVDVRQLQAVAEERAGHHPAVAVVQRGLVARRAEIVCEDVLSWHGRVLS